MSSELAILILAGGCSRRFGQCKLLANYLEKPLIAYSLDHAQKLAPNHVFLLTGAWHSELQQAHESTKLLAGVQVIYHKQWQLGMGSSIATGIKHLAKDYNAVMIMLADQPLITLADYRQLLSKFERDAVDVSCSLYANKRAVPAVFNRSCFDELIGLKGSRGAQKLLYHTAYTVTESKLPAGLVDIDSKDDLNKLNESSE